MLFILCQMNDWNLMGRVAFKNDITGESFQWSAVMIVDDR